MCTRRRAASLSASALLVLLFFGSLAEAQSEEERAPTLGAVYPADRTQSPITPTVANSLRAIAERGDLDARVFAKIGASATVNRNFLRCFARPEVELAGRDHLAETIRFFNEAPHVNPFQRRSESATVGWHAGRAIWGRPPPAVREVRDLQARFAVVMYGTNDMELGRPVQYARLMSQLIRMLTVRGVIPVLSTILPRDDDPDADRLVPLYNAVVRGLAQRHRLPMIDLHRELAPLDDHGLSQDGVHPNVLFVDGNPRGCRFDEQGLLHGYNIRNLLTIEALDRMRRHVIEREPAPDVAVAAPAGAGSIDDPIRVAALPFSHAGDTERSPHRDVDRYSGCADADESGPEVVYRVEVDEPAQVFAMVVADDGVDVDLHLLQEGESGPACVERGNEHLDVQLDRGTHYFAVDTFVDRRGHEESGRYLFVVARTDGERLDDARVDNATVDNATVGDAPVADATVDEGPVDDAS